jgi:hypothetical protein
MKVRTKPGLIHSKIKGTFNVESPTYIVGIRTFTGEIKPNKWPRSYKDGILERPF